MVPSSSLRVCAMMGTPARLLPNFTSLTPTSRTCAKLISTSPLAPSRESIKSIHIQEMMRRESKERRLDGADAVVDIDAIAEELDNLGDGESDFQRFPDDDVFHRQGCQMAKFDPFLSLDCIGLDGERRKGKEWIKFCSVA